MLALMAAAVLAARSAGQPGDLVTVVVFEVLLAALAVDTPLPSRKVR